MEPKRLSENALKCLSSLSFPGNVRQLENVCHWLMVMAPGQNIDTPDLPPDLRETGAAQPTADNWQTAFALEVEQKLQRGEAGIIDELTHQFERILIEKALAYTGGKRIEAALLLGWGRNTLTRKIQELGMDNHASEAE